VKVIAFECGFGSAGHMRAVFTKLLGISPSQYRERFHMPGMAAA
jgi:transcriptional regulator GlxA family with amidase domain